MSKKPPHPSFLTGILESRKYSDLTLLCGDRKFHLHKNIVCSQSPVLAAACDIDFLETNPGVINVSSFDVETVQHMINFMYEGSYEVPELSSQTGNISNDPTMADKVLPHVLVSTIADYYKIPGLLEDSNRNISELLKQPLSLEGFMPVIKIATQSSGDAKLRDMMISFVGRHRSEFIHKEEFEKLNVVNPFGLGLVKLFDEEVEAQKKENKQLQHGLEQQKHSLTAQCALHEHKIAQSIEFSKRSEACVICIEDLRRCVESKEKVFLRACTTCDDGYRRKKTKTKIDWGRF